MSCQSCADLQPFRLSVSSQYRFEALLLSVHAFQHFLCQLTSSSPESTGTRFSLLFWSFWKCSRSSDMCQTFCKQCKTTGTGNHLISPKSPSASVLFAVFFKTNLDFTVNVKKQAAWLFFFLLLLDTNYSISLQRLRVCEIHGWTGTEKSADRVSRSRGVGL